MENNKLIIGIENSNGEIIQKQDFFYFKQGRGSIPINKFSKYKKEIQEVEEEVKDIPEKWDLKIPDFINKK